MFNLKCDQCNYPLELDNNLTMENYLAKVDYLKDSIDNITNIATSTPLYYTCTMCGGKQEHSLSEVITKFKQQLILDVKTFRKIHIFRNFINPLAINPDNGMAYCGNCIGVENGNCYIDVIKQCPFKEGSDEL